ncbi:hypothetical protein N8993_11590 [Pseudomonadales bacterium]|nr:hypothetical protein [Pseudomonadales bacterium]MDB2543103.1 hypothetical protein [Pseudomonadales bacterium]
MIRWLDSLIALILGLAIIAIVLVPILFEGYLYRLLLWNSTEKAGRSFTQYVPNQLYFDKTLQDLDVLIVGSSDIREFFPHNDELLELFAKKCGNPVKAFNGASSSQSLAGSLAVVDVAHKIGLSPKVVIIGLSEGRLTLDNTSPVVALDRQRIVLPPSDQLIGDLHPVDWLARHATLWAEVSRLWMYGNEVKNFSFDQRQEIPSSNQNRYAPPPLPSLEKNKRLALDAKILHNHFRLNAVTSMKMYRDHFAKSEAPIFFLYTPRSPLAWDRLQEIEKTRRHAIGNSNESLPVVDMQFTDFLIDSDFYDSSHLLPQGREKIWHSKVGLDFVQSICDQL